MQKTFTSFSIFPENCEILSSFYSPHKIVGKIVSSCPKNKFGKNFTSFSHRTKLTKFLQVFVPLKFEKILQVFVPGTNRENFYKFLSPGKIERQNFSTSKMYRTICHGRGRPHP